jgi:hypothetical protein
MILLIPPHSAERTNSASLNLASDGWERWERGHHQRELSCHIAAAVAALLQHGRGGSAVVAGSARQQRGNGGGGISTPAAASLAAAAEAQLKELLALATETASMIATMTTGKTKACTRSLDQPQGDTRGQVSMPS